MQNTSLLRSVDHTNEPRDGFILSDHQHVSHRPLSVSHHFCQATRQYARNNQARTYFSLSFVSTTFYCAVQLMSAVCVKMVVEVPQPTEDAAVEDDVTLCELCLQGDREESLLLCDGCNAGFE